MTRDRRWTPLHRAAKKNDLSTAREILECNSCFTNAQDSNGETPLYIATKRGFVKMAELLFSYGADMKIETKNHKTPACLVSREKNPKMVRVYREHMELLRECESRSLGMTVDQALELVETVECMWLHAVWSTEHQPYVGTQMLHCYVQEDAHVQLRSYVCGKDILHESFYLWELPPKVFEEGWVLQYND